LTYSYSFKIPRQERDAFIFYEQILVLFILTLFLTYVYFYKIKNLIKAPLFQETSKPKNNDDNKREKKRAFTILLPEYCGVTRPSRNFRYYRSSNPM